MPGIVLFAMCAALPLLAEPAWAQADGPAPDVVQVGAWGLIVLGLMLFAVALSTKGDGTEVEGRSISTRLPFLRILQARIAQETTGWRRLQWPVLGLFFTGLGIATLLGWR